MNRLLRMLITEDGGVPYEQKLINIYGRSSIVGLWPSLDPSGTVAVEKVNGYNGAYGGTVALANVPGPDGRLLPLYTAGYLNAYSAAVRAAFNSAEFTIQFWAKGNSSFYDTITKFLTQFRADGTNLAYIIKGTTKNRLDFRVVAGGTTSGITINDHNPVDWTMYTLTCSKSGDFVRGYINDVPIRDALTGIGTWSGLLASANTTFGASGNTAGSPWSGWQGFNIVLNRAATLAEIKQAFRAAKNYPIISVIGDSISVTAGTNGYQVLVTQQYNAGKCTLANHAVSSTKIIGEQATQVAQAADDDANIIIMETGTNDNDAGDMGVLQSTLETNIAALQLSNPRARIFYMGVLPRWTDVGGGTEVDKSHIRTAQQAACVTTGITYVDTYTDPWIAADETIDGLHPTEAVGHVKIAARWMAILTT